MKLKAIWSEELSKKRAEYESKRWRDEGVRRRESRKVDEEEDINIEVFKCEKVTQMKYYISQHTVNCQSKQKQMSKHPIRRCQLSTIHG